MSGMPDDTPRQYLLRRLPDADASQFEERLLSDDTCAEQLREAEDDLIDDYAAARLTPEERDAVERYLLHSAEGEQRLRFARALADAARQAGGTPDLAGSPGASRSTPVSLPIRWLAPLGLLIAAGIAYVVLALPRSPAPASPGASPEGTPAAAAAPRPATPARSPDETPAYALLLLADVRRGTTSAQRVSIPSGTTRVRLQLELATDAPASGEPPTYQVVVRDANGQQLFAAASLGARQVGAYRIVEAEAPVSVLGTGERAGDR